MAQSILDSAPQEGQQESAPAEEFVLEGSPEALELQQQQQNAPQDKDELKEQLRAMQEKLAQSEGFMKGFQQNAPREKPEAAAPPSPQIESPEERAQRLRNLYLEDPVKATEEIARENAIGLAQLLANSHTTLSKELALTDPSTKSVYSKYQEEVEREVSQMSLAEKAQNPRVYQTALDRVRARHTDDILQEQVALKVAEVLKQYGIDPDKKAPEVAVRTPVGEQRSVNPQKSGSRTVVPQWVKSEADKIGLDYDIYYQHLREQGRIK